MINRRMKVMLTEESLRWLRDKRVYFDFKGRDRLKPGDQLWFEAGLAIESYTGFYDGHLLCRMGFMSYSSSTLRGEVTVGRYCSIGRGVDVILDHHPIEHVTTASITTSQLGVLAERFADDEGVEPPQGGPFAQRPVPVIEDDVWIGSHATVLPGVRISVGAVVAANSVVTRNVGPYEIVAGNPAKVIRRRFPDEVVKMLLQTEWWRYRFTDFRDLPFDDLVSFAKAFLERKKSLELYLPPPVLLAEMPIQS